MKHKILLFAGALALALQTKAQTWIHDTISTESGYLKNVYYSLANGQVAKVDADNWHIGFTTGVMSAGIIANTADQGIQLYEISDDTADFGTDLRSQLIDSMTANPMPLYNSNLTWEIGAFNQTGKGHPDYGWGEYDGAGPFATHWIVGTKIFGLILGTDTFQVFIQNKQTFQVTDAPIFNFKIAKIDGSNPITKSIALGTTPYDDRYFVYYNITTDAFINREPAVTDWDFVFSNYNDEGVVFANQQYKVFGIINNEGLEVAKVDTPEVEFDNIVANHMNYFYDTVNNSLGRAWKSAGMSGTSVHDSLCYFIKDMNGDMWQLVFTAHNSGSAATDPGLVALKKRKVMSATSVKNLTSPVSAIAIVPNPTRDMTQLVIDINERMDNGKIIVTDMMGSVVLNQNISLRKGMNAIPFSVNQWANGNYILKIGNGNWSKTQKITVQH